MVAEAWLILDPLYDNEDRTIYMSSSNLRELGISGNLGKLGFVCLRVFQILVSGVGDFPEICAI